MILSLFSGCGALDLGFEKADYKTGLAYDIRPYSINSWNRNRNSTAGKVADITKLSLKKMDADFGSPFKPEAVIGGPPCQSFTRANSSKLENDPRQKLVARFFKLALQLHERHPLDFIVMENVPELANAKYGSILRRQITRLEKNGFSVRYEILDAVNYGVAQNRKRLILVAYNRKKYPKLSWMPPKPANKIKTVEEAIKGLPNPAIFARDLNAEDIPHHPNHWCMAPKSQKFFDGSLKQGVTFGRSFKTLAWKKPSYAVSYGNREVHVHPQGKRRLSVYEAMKLQGFPHKFVLHGNLSQQITQVSEAVPPPLANSIASSIRSQLAQKTKQAERQKSSNPSMADAA